MKICVIGGSGFVGTHLIRSLNTNHEVVIFDKVVNSEFTSQTQIIDIREAKKLNSNLKGFDIVIHLAAEHKDNVTPKSLYYNVNVEGTKNILDAMDKNGIKNILFTSSVAVYGLNKDNPSEESEVDPFNEYGRTKYLAELEIEKWFKKDNVGKTVNIIRPTVIFGESNRGNVYNLLKQIVSGKFIMIGDGNNVKSMAYVKNIIGFIEYLMASEKGYQVYNYADKPDLTTNDLITTVEKKLGVNVPSFRIPYSVGLFAGYILDFVSFVIRKKLPISSVRIKKFCSTTQFSATRVEESSFVPEYSILEGLENTLINEFK